LFTKYPYIVAEAGINHNGDPEIASWMIQEAKKSGADAIKFQKYVTDEFTTPDDPLYETFKKCELPLGVWIDLKIYAYWIGIDFFATAQNPSDLEFLLTLDVPYVKIGSDDFNNTEMIKKMRSMTDKPFILSCGMVKNFHEIMNTFDYVYGDIALMVCTSLYPTPLWGANVARIRYLKNSLCIPIGFSDHTCSSLAAQLALAQGAVVFEKHFTLDHKLDGPDHSFSLTPDEFRDYVRDINNARVALGNGSFEISGKVKKMREYVLGRREKLEGFKKD